MLHDRRSERHKRDFTRGKKVLDSPLGGLEVIARRFNEIRPLQAEAASADCPKHVKDELRAWQFAEKIAALALAPDGLSRGVEMFNAQAKRHRATMGVDLLGNGETHAFAAVSEGDARGEALKHLWRYYFHGRDWERLKRCTVCGKWFVDITKNKSMARCSATCTWQWWNWDRRKQEHEQTKGALSHVKEKQKVSNSQQGGSHGK
jgi:hypothetical protein